jgi:hypothetical protein
MKENNKIELSDISKNNPFKVPDGYFDNFYDNFEKRLDKEKKGKKQKVYYLRFAVAVAASLVLMFMLYKPFNLLDSKPIVKVEQTDSISFEDYIGITSDDVYYSMTETETETPISDDVINYIASTASDYEIYMELNN